MDYPSKNRPRTSQHGEDHAAAHSTGHATTDAENFKSGGAYRASTEPRSAAPDNSMHTSVVRTGQGQTVVGNMNRSDEFQNGLITGDRTGTRLSNQAASGQPTMEDLKIVQNAQLARGVPVNKITHKQPWPKDPSY